MLKPSELFKGLGRILITIITHTKPHFLTPLRDRFKNSRYGFTVAKYKWLHNTELYVYSASLFEEALMQKSYENIEFYHMGKLLKEGDVFIDVGANIGLYTITASKLVGETGKVLAFDPSEREFELLEKNVRHNRCKNVEIFKVALSNITGYANLFVSGQSNTGVNTLMEVFTRKVVLERIDKVKTYKLDDFLLSKDIQKITIIKVDIEGGERNFLEGAKETLKKFKPVLMVEISRLNITHKGSNDFDVFKLLESMNYKVFLLQNRW